MLYRQSNHYPEAPLLPSQYIRSSQKFQMQLPLPGYSTKIPFQQKPTRFLTVNRRKHEIDYLRSHIQHQVQMQQMHYQAKIQQMRRQNQYGRNKLQKLLREQPTNLFAIPDPYIDQAKSISSNLENISLQKLYQNRNRYVMDSVDKVKNGNDRNRNNMSVQLDRVSHVQSDSGDSINQEKQAELKKQRQNDLDYIYKRNGAINTGSHFGDIPVIKKEQEKRKQKQKQKVEQIQWVQRVRAAKKFIEDDKQSVDSSKPSQSSQQKKKKKKQQQQAKKQKTQQNSQRVRSNYQNSRINTNINNGNNSRMNEHNYSPPISRSGQVNHTVPSQRNYKPQREMQRISQRTPSREQDISNISQFSRYAEKNDIFNKDKIKAKNDMAAIPERDNEEGDILPVMQRRRERGRGNWKV